MYSQKICDETRRSVEKSVGRKLARYSIEDCDTLVDLLNKKWDQAKGELRSSLSSAETQFVQNERLMCSIDHGYWRDRYARIKTKSPGPPKPFRMWESQRMLYDLISKLEESATERNDGVMIANLKARQLGMSTCYEMILSHRAFFTPGFSGLLAADEPMQSEYLFSMMERLYDCMPWFLRPSRRFHVKGTQMSFDALDSVIFVQHGNQKMDLGRGKTIHGSHLSELEKWNNPQQIDDGLLPAMPRLKTTHCYMESTGEFRGSWWHEFFGATMAGETRFTAFFVPWYAEAETYRKPCPDDWVPDVITLDHARKVESESPRWMGKKCSLDREQLYFWETERKGYHKRGELGVFYCEYASSPEEAFRSANASVFPYEVIERLRGNSSHPKYYEVQGRDIDHEAMSVKQLKAGRFATRHV